MSKHITTNYYGDNYFIDINVNDILIDVKTRRTMMIRIYSGRARFRGARWWLVESPWYTSDISERNMKEETPNATFWIQHDKYTIS